MHLGDTNIQIKQNGLFVETTIKDLADNYKNKNYAIISCNIEGNFNEVDGVGECKSMASTPVIELIFSNKTKLVTTPNHKIYTKNRKWVQAQELTTTDDIIAYGFFKNYPVKLVSMQPAGEREVFDLKIQGNRNYYANGILVSN